MTTSIIEAVRLRSGTYLSPQLFPTYQAIVRALGDAVGLPWTLTESSTLDELTQHRFDLAFLCGAHYLTLAAQPSNPVRLLAAPVLRGRRYGGQPWYFSDVVVRADSAITAWGELRGRHFGINEPGSHSGFAVVQEHLQRRKTDWQFFGRVTQTGSHLQSLAAILAGEIDAAAIDSQVWDVYRQRHRGLSKQLRSLTMLGPSTAPPIVVHRDIPAVWFTRLQAALLTLHNDPTLTPLLARGGIRRFVAVTDADYATMRDTWERHRRLSANDTLSSN
jgi:phosphonate transport system substrate-binding protein